MVFPSRQRFFSVAAGGQPQEGDEHGRDRRIILISLSAEALFEKCLLQARFQSQAQRHETEAQDRADGPVKDRQGEGRGQDAGVDRVPDQPVGAALHDPVFGLPGHRTGPQRSKVQTSPPAEGKTH
jgi:hypothetical protein